MAPSNGESGRIPAPTEAPEAPKAPEAPDSLNTTEAPVPTWGCVDPTVSHTSSEEPSNAAPPHKKTMHTRIATYAEAHARRGAHAQKRTHTEAHTHTEARTQTKAHTQRGAHTQRHTHKKRTRWEQKQLYVYQTALTHQNHTPGHHLFVLHARGGQNQMRTPKTNPFTHKAVIIEMHLRSTRKRRLRSLPLRLLKQTAQNKQRSTIQQQTTAEQPKLRW